MTARWRLAILAAERRYNFSHGREPVVFDWHSALAPLGAAQLLCRPSSRGCALSSLRFARGWEVVEIPIHGLTPVAMVVSPLRGYETKWPISRPLRGCVPT